MDGLSERSAASLTIGITYTAYNFEHCGHTIVEYSNDLLIQHRAIGREIPRKAINLAFEANVKDIYAEGSVMRQELLEQVRASIPLSSFFQFAVRLFVPHFLHAIN